MRYTVIEPNKPEHDEREYQIPMSDSRLTIRRVLEGYAYPANGNVHNPTPHYLWLLMADRTRIVDSATTKGAMVQAALNYGADYLAEIS